ncbi:MAG TPA: cytochrome c family protein [Caulobacteraceae bacterium]
MRAAAIAFTALALAACGGSDEQQGSADNTPSRPVPEQMSPDEQLAVLASLPAPYNTADLENGRRRFAQCRSCHTLPEGGPNLVGPNLHGVFGREVGSKPGFNYSKPAQDANFVWDGPKLDQWLTDPRGFLPGTKMVFPGIKDPNDRRDVVGYLMVESGYRPGGATAQPAAAQPAS